MLINLPSHKKGFHSIQQKLSFSFVMILTPVVILVSSLSYRNTKMVLEKKAFEQVETVINLKQENINSLLNKYLTNHKQKAEEIAYVATQSSYTTYAKILQIRQIVSSNVLNNAVLEQNVIDDDGEVIASSASQPENLINVFPIDVMRPTASNA